jgi:hypothetical protein
LKDVRVPEIYFAGEVLYWSFLPNLAISHHHQINSRQVLGFMHHDLTEPNCIVDNDSIVGLIDWEMAGFFGWKTAGEVHRRLRIPQREHFPNLDLSEKRLQDICFGMTFMRQPALTVSVPCDVELLALGDSLPISLRVRCGFTENIHTHSKRLLGVRRRSSRDKNICREGTSLR